MICLYCNKEVEETKEYPYPYVRYSVNDKSTKMIKSLKKDEVQTIRKFVCSCGYPSFAESRLGYDNRWYHQQYKQGLYILFPNMR